MDLRPFGRAEPFVPGQRAVGFGDTGQRVLDGFAGDGHMMRIGVDHGGGVEDQRHMAFPEQKVIALDVARDGACTCHGVGKAGLLLVAVTGAGNATGEEGGLNEARAIDPQRLFPPQR